MFLLAYILTKNKLLVLYSSTKDNDQERFKKTVLGYLSLIYHTKSKNHVHSSYLEGYVVH